MATPTIDPAEFSEHGATPKRVPAPVYDPALDDLSDINLHPPGSPGWEAKQQMREVDTLPAPMEEENRQRRAERIAKEKHAAANRKFHEEAALHQQEMAKEAALKQADLETLLSLLEPVEGRAVRMEAYLRALDAGHGNARERQLHADGLALKIAKYMVEGRAE